MSSTLCLSILCSTLVLSVLGAAVPPKCPPEGPVPVFFPDDSSCSKYWICSHGYPIQQECSVPLHWDQARSTCNMPSEANCQITTLPPQPTTQPPTQPTQSTTEPSTPPPQSTTQAWTTEAA